ncbi:MULTISPECIES: hypothetical protein [Marivita]|uniref:Uncharacterized protein n=1 Tax=Marivita cryptomonadis TaxID=505252 RepID=A0A9Q2NYP1_9RHOB|nr:MULTISPECIES: hypothetical protein [Marivita]MCR9169510.1 hypothetical protein [Paracoccaceae bacterium]MBM2322227.1 hypothetical protein [Marivita cryptomonadis]MBM2331808.1 hypothetical protein [Marivita cryptomonadis]MBM2341393.1 hypothetical protein [Marivita cryptomonadis]MBM2346056.1 hypothetical protein [Marivita cryptomonadis]
MSVEPVIKVLMGWQYDLSTEAAMHRGLAHAFTLAGIAHRQEVSLTEHDRIDFYLPDQKIGIEVKLSCAARQIYRQIERYTESDEITSIILLTNTAVGLPTHINGKPVYVVHAGMCSL